MKNSRKANHLIEDIMNPATGIEEILALVGKEKAARRKRRAAVQTGALAVLALAFFFSTRTPAPDQPAASVAAAGAASSPHKAVHIQIISDEELMQRLADLPVAIVQAPDGSPQLYMLKETPAGERLCRL